MIDPTHVCETIFCGTSERHKSYVSLFFTSQEDAQTFFVQLSRILPFLNEDYPRIENTVVKATEDQYYFYTLYKKQEKNTLSASDVGDHYLLKTLGADKFDFSRAFILGLIPGEEGPRRQNLRPVQRNAYTVTPEGTIRARINKLPMYTHEQKGGFTQVELLVKHEGLSYIKPQYDQTSFFFQSKNFYTALLNKLTENNFEGIFDLSQAIISNEDRKVRWHQVLDRQFHLAVKKTQADRAYLLVRLGANPEYSCTFEDCCGLSAIDMASTDGNERVVQYLLEHYNFSLEMRELALCKSIQGNGFLTRIPYLHLKHGAIVTQKVIKIAATRGDENLIISLLDRIEKDRFNSPEFLTAAYAVWREAHHMGRVRKKLSTMLDSSMVKHFTLIDIMVILVRSINDSGYTAFKSFRDISSVNLDEIMLNPNVYDGEDFTLRIVDSIETFRDLALILNQYFYQPNNLFSGSIEGSVVASAYQEVRAQFLKIDNSVTHRLKSIKPRFFSRTCSEDELVSTMLNYLRCVDQLLTEHQPSPTDNAQLSQAPEIDSPRQIVNLH